MKVPLDNRRHYNERGTEQELEAPTEAAGKTDFPLHCPVARGRATTKAAAAAAFP